ncbi:MAG: DNA mismatch repair protein [Cryobacterium sp.]
MPTQLTKCTRTISLFPVRDGLWRVIGRSGAVLGHVQRFDTPDGQRYQARRVAVGAGAAPRVLGDFCRIDEAEDCFR